MSDILQSTLKTKLQAVVDNYITGSTSASDVLNVSLSVWAQNEPNILVVDSVANLPYLEYNTSPNSIICFVSNIGVFAISANLKWLTLDGRLLRSDITLGLSYAWGSNAYGKLGLNTPPTRSSPTSVVGSILDWCQVSAGAFDTSTAARTSGSIWSWGRGGSGALGNNAATNRSSPVSVVGGFSDWCQVSTGWAHALAIRTAGTAWAWGANSLGSLGDGTTTTRSSPVSVVGGFSDWCQGSASQCSSMAVRSSGSAWAWGRNDFGQLGDNSTTNRSSPVSVVGGFTDWCQVSMSCRAAMGLRSNGTIWSWGHNLCGQLGDNSLTNSSSPVSVVGGFSDWAKINSTNADAHRAAIRSNGSLWTWGCNLAGQLGDNTITNRSSPVSVVGGFSDWCQTSAGTFHSAAVRTNGSAWAWGWNSNGNLGTNSIVFTSSPVSVVGGFTSWCQLSAGNCFTLGIISI